MAIIQRFMGHAVFAATLLAGAPAKAGFIGNSMELYSVTSTTTSMIVFVIDDQVEYRNLFDCIDISDRSIEIGTRQPDPGSGDPAIGIPQAVVGEFIGFRLVDHLNLIAPILDVEIDYSTLAGISIADIEIFENEIIRSFEKPDFERSESYVPGDVIPEGVALLNVFGQISEPDISALFCAALLSIVLTRRRRLL